MELTTEGMIFLILCWSLIVSLVSFCFFKVMTTGKRKD